MPDNSQAEILQSWKEISAYVRRGVRTLQRYERLMRFPIRRPLGKKRSSVIAFKAEVDAWLQRSPYNTFSSHNGHEKNMISTAGLAKPVERARVNRAQARNNREQAQLIRQSVRQQRESICQMRERLAAILSKHSRATYVQD